MDFFQKLALEKLKEKPILIWHTILVKYEGDKTTIVKSFSTPAKDSVGKFSKKTREKKIVIEEPNEPEELF